MKGLFRYAGFVLAFVAAGVAAQDQGKPATPAEQYQALLKEFQTAAPTYFQSTPTYYVFDPKGVIRFKWVGYPGAKAIDTALEELLKEFP